MNDADADGPGPGADAGEHRTPRWVKVAGIIALVLVLVLVGVLLFAGGEHGPGRHGASASPAAASSCETAPYSNSGGSGAQMSCTDVTGAGTTEQAFACAAGGHAGIQVEWDLGGDVTIAVRDVDGSAVFSRTYTGSGGEQETFAHGRAGEWTLTAERDGPFDGSFSVSTFCSG